MLKQFGAGILFRAFTIAILLSLGAFKINALDDQIYESQKSIYNELIKNFNARKIQYLENTENPLIAMLYSSSTEKHQTIYDRKRDLGTLIFICSLESEIEVGGTLPWFHEVLLDYLDAVNYENLNHNDIEHQFNFDIFVIWTYRDPAHILYRDLAYQEDIHSESADNLAVLENLNLRFILDDFDTDEKVVVIDAAFYGTPTNINVQKSSGAWKPPLEIISPFFASCINQNIPASFINIEKSELAVTLNDWDYDFPVISLNSKDRLQNEYDAAGKDTISKDSMKNMLLEYSKLVMKDNGTDYSRHYLYAAFLNFNFLIPEFVMVVSLLFGSALIFFVTIFIICVQMHRRLSS